MTLRGIKAEGGRAVVACGTTRNTGAASSELLLNRNVVEYDGTHVAVECTYTGRRTMLAAEAIVTEMPDRVAAAHIASVTSIGDCWAPSTIQQAVYSGHKWARELDEEPEGLIPRELPMISSDRLKAMS